MAEQMEVRVDGKVEFREVESVVVTTDLLGVERDFRRCPVTEHGEECIHVLGGPPYVVKTLAE